MANTFSGSNSESYEISNVDQLIGLRSQKDRNFRISVRHSNIDSAIYTSVIIYNELKNTEIISLLTSCENDILGVSDAIISRDNLILVLASFGFNVQFSDSIDLTAQTKQFLQSLYDVGFRYFKFTSDGMIVLMSNSNDSNYATASLFSGFDLCDFSRFILSSQPQTIYNIGDYI